MAHFPFMESVVETFRSVLFFENAPTRKALLKPKAGPAAIERYLEPHEGGRLIQSLKSFAASRLFQQTQINGRPYLLEELIGIFLRILRTEAERQFGSLGSRLIAGRPVRFVGARQPDDDQFAIDRLRRAYAIAGFDDVVFEYEPTGAAWEYGRRLQREELVLIADFGGGTSDFSLVRAGPGGQTSQIVGTSGVPIGGDTFDAQIVRHLVSPLLGLGSSYRSMEKILPIPSSLYLKLESWHHLSFLRSKETVRMIQSLRAQALEPEKIGGLLEIVEEDLGYHLHRSVQRLKVDLSAQEEALFEFTDASVSICRNVRRSQFESWVADDLERIASCVEDLLARVGLTPADLDRVFLTGGSSLVPAVRQIFVYRFGEGKIASGGEFVSVARGLALRGLEE